MSEAEHAADEGAERAERPGAERAGRTSGRWKAEALLEFRRWLGELPDEPEALVSPSGGGAVPDLSTLLSEMAALRQEVKLSSREQARATRALESAAERQTSAVELLRGAAGALERLPDAVREDAELTVVRSFLEVRDALERGWAAAARRRAWWVLGRATPDASGFELALERFDRVLSDMGVRRVRTVGERFDPDTMRAVGTVSRPGESDGTVLEEERTGHVHGQRVVRLADVIACRNAEARSVGHDG